MSELYYGVLLLSIDSVTINTILSISYPDSLLKSSSFGRKDDIFNFKIYKGGEMLQLQYWHEQWC